jgi:hypothetical protein
MRVLDVIFSGPFSHMTKSYLLTFEEDNWVRFAILIFREPLTEIELGCGQCFDRRFANQVVIPYAQKQAAKPGNP